MIDQKYRVWALRLMANKAPQYLHFYLRLPARPTTPVRWQNYQTELCWREARKGLSA